MIGILLRPQNKKNDEFLPTISCLLDLPSRQICMYIDIYVR